MGVSAWLWLFSALYIIQGLLSIVNEKYAERNGVTTVPWKCGKLLVWDGTCPDTFAPSYVSQATTAAGEVAAQAEERKCSCLPDFVPVAIETTGVIGPQTSLFMKELGRRARGQTGDPLASSYIFQRLSIAIQRGNSSSIMGSEGHGMSRHFFRHSI